jgi:hypothetical protein
MFRIALRVTRVASPLREGERTEVRGFQNGNAFGLPWVNPHPPPLPCEGRGAPDACAAHPTALNIPTDNRSILPPIVIK